MTTFGPDVRTLEAADAPLLDAFLCRHVPTSLALLANLRAGGIVCEERPQQAHYIALADRHGIHGVLALGTDDLVFIQCPEIGRIPFLVQAWKAWFAGGALGLAGPRDQIDKVIGLLGGEALPFRFSNTEQVFAAPTAQVVLPSRAGDALSCRLATESEFPLLCAWQLSFLMETMRHEDTEALRAHLHQDMLGRFQQHRLFVLCDGNNQPLATAQAVLAVRETVQIGGVYVPPESRNRGYGRALVALLAGWLAQRDVTRMVFFSNRQTATFSTMAEALGFRSAGAFGLALFNQPVSPP